MQKLDPDIAGNTSKKDLIDLLETLSNDIKRVQNTLRANVDEPIKTVNENLDTLLTPQSF